MQPGSITEKARATIACALGMISVCHAAELTYTTRKNTMEWFEGARFGLFIHWDPRADWSPADGDFNVDIRPATKRAQEVGMWADVLDERGAPTGRKRWQTWNPSRFDADEWVKLFLAAGAKYATFTTMHMWCFSNFDHPSTTFDVMSTSGGRDLVAHLARAAEGRIPLMWYHNMYPSKHITGSRWDHFRKFLARDDITWDEFRKSGVHELIRNTAKYGKVAGIWCDGGGTFENNAVNRDFYSKMQEVQPWLIFSPRCGHAKVPKDWRVPEQKMPRMDWKVHQEMTMPIESDVWFWAQGKRANTKDAEYCIQTLIRTATRDANLLVNLSPRGDGAVDGSQAEALRGIGAWLRRYGESIFDTRGGPYEPGIWGGSTRRAKKVYLHLTQLSEDGSYALPRLPSRVLSSRMLGEGNVALTRTGDGLQIFIDPATALDRSAIDRIVELTLEDDAWAMLPREVIPTPSPKLLPATASASSENTYKRPSGKAVTDHASSVTRLASGHGGWTASEPWSKAGADRRPWLMLDLGSAKAFRTVWLKEYHSRIKRFVVEYRDPEAGTWKELYAGGRLNYFCYRMARPVSARYVRVRFTRTEGGAPQVAEFRVYE